MFVLFYVFSSFIFRDTALSVLFVSGKQINLPADKEFFFDRLYNSSIWWYVKSSPKLGIVFLI